MRRRAAPAAPPDALDSAEQEALLADLAQRTIAFSRRWQGVFSGVATLLGLAFLASGARQVVRPWDTRHHANFRGMLSSAAVAAGEIGNAACVLSTGWVLHAFMPVRNTAAPLGDGSWLAKRRKQEHLLYGVTLASAMMMGFWSLAGLHVWQVGGEEPWSSHMLWLPLSPIAMAALALYITRLAKGNEMELEQLSKQRYNFKKV